MQNKILDYFCEIKLSKKLKYMQHSTNTKWLDGMSFEWEVNGFKVVIDASESVGGKNKGPRPKAFMLSAFGGCTAMDVISILKKMRVSNDIADFNVKVSGDLTEEHPKHYYKMHVVYEFTAKEGKILNMKKIKKAVNLSEERYCGVSAVYKKTMEITSEIVIL